MEGPSPLSIATAALIMQFSLVAIIAIGAGLLSFMTDFKATGMAPLILLLAMVTLGVLLFSEPLSSVWIPVFGTTAFLGIGWSIALLIAFILDILVLALLVSFTGGSMRSVFTPIYFVLPTLAIFLREGPYHVLLYLTLVIVMFSLNLWSYYEPDWRRVEGRRAAFWFVSIACFILATFIGYVTQPTGMVRPQ